MGTHVGLRDEVSDTTFDLVIIEHIADGTFGSVHKGEMKWTNGRKWRPVAVKQARSGQQMDLRKSHLRTEGDVLQAVHHPSIVGLHGVVESKADSSRRDGQPSNPWIIQELVEGPSLAELLDRQARRPPHSKIYSTGLAGRWMLELASALEHLHAQQYIHRDINVNNIVLTSYKVKKSSVKLIDFGMAVRSDSPCHSHSEVVGQLFTRSDSCLDENPHIDRPGSSLSMQVGNPHSSRVSDDSPGPGPAGTPLHMAPEVIRPSSAKGCHSKKMDVFSFGVVLFQVFHYVPLSKYLHRSGYTIRDGHNAMLHGWRPTVSPFCPEIIGNLIRACWSVDPEQRPEFSGIVKTMETFCSREPVQSLSISYFSQAVHRVYCQATKKITGPSPCDQGESAINVVRLPRDSAASFTSNSDRKPSSVSSTTQSLVQIEADNPSLRSARQSVAEESVRKPMRCSSGSTFPSCVATEPKRIEP